MDARLTPDDLVADVLVAYPGTIPVFVRHRMDCVGCSMSKFETLRDACRIYNLDLDGFLAELHQAAASEA